MNELSCQPPVSRRASAPGQAAPLIAGAWGFVAAMLALVALTMLSVGPLVDHHFAERQFHHAHLFPSGSLPEHQHSLEIGHHHPADYNGDPVGQGATVEGVYLTSTDAAGPGIATMIPAATGVSPVFPDSGGQLFLFGKGDGDNSLSEAFPGLPKKPPRA